MITIERAKQILSSYGSNYEQWPKKERLSLQQLLLSNNELQAMLQRDRQLDAQFSQLKVGIEIIDTERLEQKILQSLPARKKLTDSEAAISCRISIKATVLGKLSNFYEQWSSFFISGWALGFAVVVLVTVVTLAQLNRISQTAIPNLISMDDELLLMAEELGNTDDLALLAVFEPELVEDDLDIL